MLPWSEKTHANTFAWEKNCSAPRSQVFKLVMVKFPLWGNEDKKASVPLAKRMEASRHKDCYLYNQCAPYKLTFPELPLLRVYTMAMVVPPPQQWKYSYPRCLASSHYASRHPHHIQWHVRKSRGVSTEDLLLIQAQKQNWVLQGLQR